MRTTVVLAISLAVSVLGCSTSNGNGNPSDCGTVITPDAEPGDAPASAPDVPDAPDVLTCASALVSACHDKNHGNNVPCPPTWSETRCAAPVDDVCAGFLGMADGDRGVCAYDANSRKLVAYAALGLDTPPSCYLGVGVSIPVSCVEEWLRAAGACDLQHEALHPWYCESLPGQTDQGAPCTSDSECNGGGACLFNTNITASCESAVGRCSTLETYDAGCALSESTACSCNGTTMNICNSMARLAVWQLAPCPIEVDAGVSD